MCRDLPAVCQWSLLDETQKTWTATIGLRDAEWQELGAYTKEAEGKKIGSMTKISPDERSKSSSWPEPAFPVNFIPKQDKGLQGGLVGHSSGRLRN